MRDIYRTIGAVLVAIVALLGAAAVLHIIVALPIKDNRGPEWVGAIGTVATLAGTIWLATAETRRRHKDQLLLARLRGASILFRICHANQAAIDLRALMEAASFDDLPIDRLQCCRKIFETIENWTTEDMAALVPLRDHVAANMAEITDRLGLINKKLIEASSKCTDDGVYTSTDWASLARSCQHFAQEVVLRTSDVIYALRHVSSELRHSSE
jgi:hypothetical protein